MSFAKAVISGTLTNDPEKRFTPNNHAVTSFTVSVENPSPARGGNDEPFLVNVTCWRALAEAVTTQLQKGDNVLVEGKLLMNSFQGQDGVQRKLFEVEANAIDKLPGRPEPIAMPVGAGQTGGGEGGYNSGNAGNRPAAAPAYATPPRQGAPAEAPSTGHFSSEDLLTEDDIPF